MGYIAGIVDYQKRDDLKKHVMLMSDVLRHQSKKKQEIALSEKACFVSENLAQVNIQGKRVMVVLDGELVQKENLYELCKHQGMLIESGCDAELVLKSYLLYHQECVTKLNGVFAFAIIDERNDSFFFARDPMGVKPLFYAMRNDGIVFASEIKGLFQHPEIHAQVGAEELMEMICVGPGRTPGKTYFKGIEEVKPGYTMTLTRNGAQHERYVQLMDQPWTLSEEKTIEWVHDVVSQSVQERCDQENTAMLSGGLDSSVVCAIAAKNDKLTTYSVDYEGQKENFKPTFYQPNRDQDFIDLMVERYKLEAHEIVLSPHELKQQLKTAMIARDMPGMADVDSSLLCFCEKMKHRGETVVLSGECSDEIFGGYPWYTQEHLRTVEHFPWANNVKMRARYLKPEFLVQDPERFVKDRLRMSLDQLTFRKETTSEDKLFKQLMKLNLDWFMQTLIDRADRMARCTGLSIRVPLCDLRIVKALYQIPWSMKYQNNTEKYLLRKAFEVELPEEICWRKKSPYPKTHDPIYAQMMKEELCSILQNETSPLLEIVNQEELMNLLESDSPVPWYGQLMTGPQTMAYFIQINEWLKEYQIEIIRP